MFAVFVARLERASGELVGNAFDAASGARFRVTAAHIRDVAELVRPGASLEPPDPPAAPEAVVEPEPPAEPANTEPVPPTADEPAETDRPAGPEPEPAADPAATARAALAESMRTWPELAGGWTHFAAVATFTAAGPHAAVVEVNGEELGRARFYLMEGLPDGGELA